MEKQAIIEAIKKAKENSKPRKFKQTVDMIINLKGIDTKTFSLTDVIELPKGRGKPVKVCAVGTGDFLLKAKECADFVIDAKNELSKYSDKKLAKKIANEYDFFVVEAPVMVEFAKVFGPVLGSRGKMPSPQHIVPPTANPCPIIERVRKTIRIRARKNPVIHTVIGTEDMSEEDLAKNAEAVLEHILNKLERGKHNIKNIYIKLTMGKPVKVHG